MKKSIIKRLFIKLSKVLGYEIIDQSDFNSPTLQKKLNEDLSIINEKSIILPLGEVKITKKVSSILIIFRTNTDIEIWDQNKKRLFEEPKIEYSLRALKSLIRSVNFSKINYPNIKFKIIIVDEPSIIVLPMLKKVEETIVGTIKRIAKGLNIPPVKNKRILS